MRSQYTVAGIFSFLDVTTATAKLKSWYWRLHWFICLEREKKALLHSPCGDDALVPDLETSLYTSLNWLDAALVMAQLT